MASTPIEFTLDTDEISVEDLAGIVSEFTAYLTAIDIALSPTGRRTLDFRLTSLSYNSPASIGAVAEPREDTIDMAPDVIRLGVRGIHGVEQDAPGGLPYEALDHLRKLAGYASLERGHAIIEAPTLAVRAAFTKSIIPKVERVLSQGDAIGAIEGYLDTVSVHGQPYFTLYDAVTGRGVRCYFSDARRVDVVAALGKRVVAHGRIRRDAEGTPREMRQLDEMHELAPENVEARGLAGVYRGLDVRRYLADIRGE